MLASCVLLAIIKMVNDPFLLFNPISVTVIGNQNRPSVLNATFLVTIFHRFPKVLGLLTEKIFESKC